jgi:hypothetical protein
MPPNPVTDGGTHKVNAIAIRRGLAILSVIGICLAAGCSGATPSSGPTSSLPARPAQTGSQTATVAALPHITTALPANPLEVGLKLESGSVSAKKLVKVETWVTATQSGWAISRGQDAEALNIVVYDSTGKPVFDEFKTLQGCGYGTGCCQTATSTTTLAAGDCCKRQTSVILNKPGTYTVSCVYKFQARPGDKKSEQYFNVAGATPKVKLVVQ